MENEIFKKLKVLVEVITHSGCDTLDEGIFKEIKGICKSSQDNVLHVYRLVLAELKKNNSQIRFAAFKLCKEFFKRSSLFRENVLRDFRLIFDLTTEINSSKKLPPPKSSARAMERLMISTLKAWVEEFGETYKKLKVAYKYLENCKQVNFETLEVRSIVENERQRHMRVIGEERIKRVLEEFNSNLPEIENTVTSLSNCMSLLLPPAEDFFISEKNLQKISIKDSISNCQNKSNGCEENSNIIEVENEDNENYLWDNKSNLRECGISFNYNLSLELNLEEAFKIDKTKENNMVIENAKDCVKLLSNRYYPMVKKWIKVHCIYGERNSSNVNVKKIIDLKEKLENTLKKYNSLIINEETCINSNDTDSDEDYEFEEVKKEGYEETVDFPEELMLACLKKTPDSGNSMYAIPSTSKDSFKVESIINTPTSTGAEKSDSECFLKFMSSLLDKKNKTLSVSSKSCCDTNTDNLSGLKGKLNSWADINDKFWKTIGINDLHNNLDGIPVLGTKVSTVLKRKNKKRKSENKNLTHKKMKTCSEALKILESKNLPGLVDVVKRQNSTHMRLSKKLFSRSSRKK